MVAIPGVFRAKPTWPANLVDRAMLGRPSPRVPTIDGVSEHRSEARARSAAMPVMSAGAKNSVTA
jgi:hypothetical protein